MCEAEEGTKRSLFLSGVATLLLCVIGAALRHGLGLPAAQPLHRVLPLAAVTYAAVVLLGLTAWRQLGLGREGAGWTRTKAVAVAWALFSVCLGLYGVAFTVSSIRAGL